MVASFFLALREGLEATLIVGIALGALRRMNRSDLVPAVWRGVVAGAFVSLVIAVVLTIIGARFEGRAEQIFEGIAMLLAAGILTWMIFWMRRQARKQRENVEAHVKQAVFSGGQSALFLLAFSAVVREGLELALFLIAAGLAVNTGMVISGAILGLIGAVVAGWLLFSGTKSLNIRAFFQVTNVLLLLFAAGLVAHGVHEFNEAGIIPSVIDHVWDINFILDKKSVLGSLLKAMFGYNGNPSLTEVLSYGGYFVVLLGALGLTMKKKEVSSVAA